MKPEEYSLDEILESAIREKGAKELLQRVETRSRRRQRAWRTATFSFAATFTIVVVGAVTLSYNTRSAGYAFDPVAGQMGGSEITALMQSGDIRSALKRIDEARSVVSREMADPSSTDPEYAVQLEEDMQELDLLSAVCYMRQGRYFKAKKTLKSISENKGVFAADAESLRKSF